MGQLTYTTQEVQDRLDAVGTLVRPNLLDNWYFVGGGSQQGGGQFPINQRGATSYSGGVYGIDRWRAWNSAVTVTINSGGIAVQNASSSSQQFVQYFDSALTADLAGKTLTLSVLVGADLYSVTGTGGSQTWVTTQFGSIQIGIGNGNLQATQIFVSGNTTASNIKAAKLEIGDTQTLAHQENGVWVLNEVPNYQQELARCQRYCLVANLENGRFTTMYGATSGTSTAQLSIPTPVPMRTIPTFSSTPQITISCNGTDYSTTNYSQWTYSAGMITFKVNSLTSGSFPGTAYPVKAHFNSGTLCVISADL